MAGFVYISDGKRPDEGTFQEKFIKVIQFKPHWNLMMGGIEFGSKFAGRKQCRLSMV